MGDVIHALPAVSDLAEHFPDMKLDWVVEESFAELPALHPAVSGVIPLALRRWRKRPASLANWREFAAFRRALQANRYDLVLDLQGLIKSAWIASLAHGPRCGYDGASAREPLAALVYDRTIRVERDLHAVERMRLLAGHALGYTPAETVNYGIAAPGRAFSWLSDAPYVVLLHATSRVDKEWPEAEWLALADGLNRQGLQCVLPWGSEREKSRSERLALQMQHAVVPPRLGLSEAAALLGGARAVVGVDTGLSHLAAALDVPVVALYLASDPGLTGVYGRGRSINLGRAGQPPCLEAVVAGLDQVMQG